MKFLKQWAERTFEYAVWAVILLGAVHIITQAVKYLAVN